MAPTSAQQALITAIAKALSADSRIESAWLSGSFGRGMADDFSDVDVTVVVPDAALEEAIGAYARDQSAIAVTVHTTLIAGRVVHAVTEDWQRFDLTFVKPDEFTRISAAAVKPLFNRGTPDPKAPAPAPPYHPPAERIENLAREFLRVLGLVAVGIGRAEYVLGLEGVGLLRQMTIDLILEQNAIAPADRGGHLHLNKLLTADQRKTLESLPPLSANRQSILDAHVALARIFLPLAKKLAAGTGAAWPQAFEDSTRRILSDRLGLSI